ncbi:MAG: methionyl-tRNA formyltransferase [Alphaproteobacteria bacterium]|nr:methionyl-tRNA formyltransferase [Alphaproteobacteria bacterium]
MIKTPLRIVFMGTPDFAAQTLQALIDSPHEVIAAYTQPPRPKGRGNKVQNTPVHDLALTHDIPVYIPKSLKGESEQEEFKNLKADIAIIAAYGLILPKAVLDAPKFGCLNVHASLLPRWRGASPIQRAIWEGDTKTGITIMQMDEGLDTGDMVSKSEIEITKDTTASSLHDQLAKLGANLTLSTLETLIETGHLESEEQDNALATYAHLLKKEDGQIDWSQEASAIDRQIRALNPWPGVFCETSDNRLKILEATLSNETTDKSAGTILDKSGAVACGNNTVLQIKKLQPAGKQSMDFTSALNGNYIKIGQVLT